MSDDLEVEMQPEHHHADHEYLLPREVADLLRVSERQVRRLRECLLLTPHVSFHRPRYLRAEVLEVAAFLGRLRVPR